MTAPAPAKTSRPVLRPITPSPLWERHQLFQEPAYVDGQPYGQDEPDSEDDEPAIITA